MRNTHIQTQNHTHPARNILKRTQSSISFWAGLEQWLDYTSTTRGWSHCRLVWLLWRLVPGTTVKQAGVWKARPDNQLWRRASTIHISALSFSLTGGASEAGNDTGCFNLGTVSTVAPEAGWYSPLRCDRAACCLWQRTHTNTHFPSSGNCNSSAKLIHTTPNGCM